MSNENDKRVQESLRNVAPSSDAQNAVDHLLKETVAPPKVVPTPNVKVPEVHQTLNAVAGKELTDDQAADMINRLNGPQLMELARRIDEAKAATAAKESNQKPRYFTASEFGNLKESDIYDFNVPIQAIDHQLPDFLDIKLKDPNYVARWINLDQRRMGQAIAEGWSYVTKNDLAAELKVQVNNSVDGHYVYADVVAMKLTKEKVYGRIRGNFLKSLSLTKSTLAIHQHMANLIKAELSNSEQGEAFQKYEKSGAMGVYSPLAGA